MGRTPIGPLAPAARVTEVDIVRGFALFGVLLVNLYGFGADSPEFRKFVENEFPTWADEMLAPPSRRGFLKIMGASLALAGMTGELYMDRDGRLHRRLSWAKMERGKPRTLPAIPRSLTRDADLIIR